MRTTSTDMLPTVLLALCCVACSVLASEDETLSRLLKEAEESHAVFQRNLNSLEGYLSLHGVSNVNPTLREKRDTMARLATSMASFCRTYIQQGPSTPASSTSTTTSTPQTEEKKTASNSFKSPITPVAVRVTKKTNVSSVVEFRVEHTTPGVVILWDALDLSNGQTKRLWVRSSQAPKTSTVRFNVKTGERCQKSEFERDPGYNFVFTSKHEDEPTVTLSVKVCGVEAFERWMDGLSPQQNNTSTGRNVMPPRPVYKFKNLTDDTLIVKKGENITVVAEVDLGAADSSSYSYFSILTRTYNQEQGLSTSLIMIHRTYAQGLDNEAYSIRSESLLDDKASQMTTVKEIIPTKNQTVPTDDNVTRGSLYRNKTLLQLTFNTASGQSTGVVYLVQTQLYPGIIGMLDFIQPLIITKDGDVNSAIPRGLVTFLPTQQVQICNINKNKESRQYGNERCGINCVVFGRGVSSVGISKVNGTTVGQLDVVSRFSQWQRHAFLSLEAERPGTSGLYQCQAVTQSGQVFEYDIELKVVGYPAIDEVRTGYNNTGKVIVFTCAASGTDLDVSIWGPGTEPEGHGGRSEVRWDTNPSYEKTVEVENGQINLLLKVPTEIAMNMTNSSVNFFCNASNPVSWDIQYYYLS